MNGAAGESAHVVRLLVGSSEPVAGVERQVSTDQANLSVAVDDRYLVKWFRHAVDRNALAVLEQLARQHFAHMPSFVGPFVEADRVVATVTEFVPGATDGWQWYVDDVLAWIDGTLPLDPLVRTAAGMGAITAHLHDALADPSVEMGCLDVVRRRVADRRRTAVAETTGSAGQRLVARLQQIDAALARLDDTGRVRVQRIHGDLHAGQFLRAGERMLLTDFDGDPLTAAAHRVDRQPVECDVASLLQSIDHVGRVAARRRPGASVDEFIQRAVDAAVGAYRATHALDHSLLFALRVGQELHEYAYAATRLPVWGYVPDQAMCALFPNEDEPT